MNMKKSQATALACVIGISVLILDTKTAVSGAAEGIDLCLKTIIPSLFPFVFLTAMLLPAINRIKLLRPVGTLCGIPQGLEHILLIGFLGGYPVGAQNVVSTWNARRISRKTAHRMLGFCSNAGPSFIFGMGSVLFEQKGHIWLVWAIHILSALLVAMILPDKDKVSIDMPPAEPVNAVTALKISLRSMGNICGWVVVFKVMLSYVNGWILISCSDVIKAVIGGFVELSNGFMEIQSISLIGLKMVIASVILAFGGICVMCQTLSCAEQMGMGFYFPGKVLQTLFSFLMAYCAQLQILPANQKFFVPVRWLVVILSFIPILLIYLYRKKIVAIQRKMFYNISSKSKKEKIHVIS